MKTTIDFLDELKARKNCASDYAIAKHLGITPSAVCNYRKGKDFFSDSTAIRVAELLEIDPAIVISSIHAERAKKPEERAIWEGIIERLGGLAAALALGIGLSAATPPAQASPGSVSHNPPCESVLC